MLQLLLLQQNTTELLLNMETWNASSHLLDLPHLRCPARYLAEGAIQSVDFVLQVLTAHQLSSTMIVEMRVPMPMTLEEFDKGWLYMAKGGLPRRLRKKVTLASSS